MKWWKQSIAEKKENNISVLTEKLFSIDNSKFTFNELLSHLHLQKNRPERSELWQLIELSSLWSTFLININNEPSSNHQTLIDEFESRVYVSKNDSLMKIFDNTFFNSALYYSKNDYFELEHFIIPIVLVLDDIEVDQRLINVIIKYYTKIAVTIKLKEVKSYNLEINIQMLDKAVAEILDGDESNYGHQYDLIRNLDSISIGGLGRINGFIRKYYQGENIGELITKNGISLIKQKLLRDECANNKEVSLKIVNDKMIARINHNILKNLGASNKGIINSLEWMGNCFLDRNNLNTEYADYVIYNTILSTLDSLYICSDLKHKVPSKKLIQAVINFCLLYSTYNKGANFGFGSHGDAYENYIFHPFIVKILQSDFVDEKLVKKLVNHGSGTSLLILSVLKCKTKNKYSKHLIRNIIYNLNVRKKHLSDKKLSGLTRSIHDNLTWDGDVKLTLFWDNQQFITHIIKNQFRSLSFINKVCLQLKKDINLKNGTEDLIVFG